MNKILSVQNLKLSFYGADKKIPAVRGVSFEVGEGEIVALVGESGCGKTAICRAVMMLHAKHAIIEDGRIVLCDNDVTEMDEKQLNEIRGRDAAMIFQDPMSSLNPTISIGKQIMEPILLHRFDGELATQNSCSKRRKAAQREAMRLLELVGIDKPEVRFRQYPHHLSGGMRQRVAIAIALAAEPKLLIADEPTTALDMDIRENIVELLKKVCKKRDETGRSRGMIFVTHDVRLAKRLADRIVVMKNGLIVEEGGINEVLEKPKHPYTRELIYYTVFERNQENSVVEKSVENMVKISGLSKSFKTGRSQKMDVIKDFNLEIKKGEIVGLVGNSGCGKSTLARCLMGIDKQDSGEIIFAENCRKQMIFQDSSSAFNPRMNLMEIISEPLIIKNSYKGSPKIQEKVLETMDMVGLERGLRNRHPYDVSGGQRQRAAIARALITEPDFLIADEPVSSLDVPVQARIIELIRKLHYEKNLTILFIAHDLAMIEYISNRVVKMTKI